MRGLTRCVWLVSVALACGDDAGPAETAGSGGSAGAAGASGAAGSAGGTAEDAGIANEDAGGTEATPDAGPPVVIGPVDKLDLLITGTELDEAQRRAFEEAGVNVLLA